MASSSLFYTSRRKLDRLVVSVSGQSLTASGLCLRPVTHVGKISFNKGMSTSSNMSIQTHDTRFRNKMCYRRLRAAVRISESEKNPGKLYYDYSREKDKRKFKFWD